jgi:hypothetical protein
MQSSGVDSAEYLYATKFLTKVLNASTTWLADLEGRIERLAGDTKKRGTSGPWDEKPVQNLVKQRTKDYQKRVKQAEGVMIRVKSVGGDPGQVALPQFTKEDLAQLIRQCPLNTRASAANNGDHSLMIASFLKECDYQYTVGLSLAGAVPSLIAQVKFTEKIALIMKT